MNFSRITPDDMRALRSDVFFGQLSASARKRLEWFEYYIENACTVEEVCEHFSISRSTFLRWQKRLNLRDPQSLEEQSRRPLRVREPEVAPEVIEHIKHYREQYPTIGKKRIAVLLKAEQDIDTSPSSIGRVINRYGFYFGDTPLHRRKRLKAAERQSSSDKSPIPLTGLSFNTTS